jgi:hypothetical protein
MKIIDVPRTVHKLPPSAYSLGKVLLASLRLGVLLTIGPVATAFDQAESFHTQQPQIAANKIMDLRWQYRLLLVSLPEVQTSGELPQGWIKEFVDHEQALLERRLFIAFETKEAVIYFPRGFVKASETFDGEVKSLLREEQALKAFEGHLLIGLDGRIKQRYRNDGFTLKEVFADIDAMPMRQSELRKK